MNNELLLMNQNTLLNNLRQAIDKMEPKNFKLLLHKNFNFLNENLLNHLFLYSLSSKNNVYEFHFLSILINFGVDPNIIIDEVNNLNNKNKNNLDLSNNDYRVGKSILMLACEKSHISLVKDLCDTNKRQKYLNVNYVDKNGRNALYYLKGGIEDGNIIELLVKKGIEVNRKDKDDNTPLNFLISNTGKVKLIYDMIEIGGANFLIKNKQGKNGMDLISEKIICRTDFAKNNYINNYEELNSLINLIKSKLAIKLFPSNKLNENIYDNDSSINNRNNFRFNNNNNLIKLSSLSTIKKTNSTDNNNIENKKEDNHNVFLKINPLSLIVDTQFNDNNNTFSTSKKIDYYTKMNKNKKYLLNLLKTSENKLKENSKLLEEKIKKKNLEVIELKNNLKERENKVNELSAKISKNIDNLNLELNDIKDKVNEKKQELLNSKNDCLYNSQMAPKYSFKYNNMIHRKKNNEYIYNQLQIDLIDFMTYVHNKNAKLENTLHKLNDLIQQSVKQCLGEDFQLKMYGSRATNLCLPWSDIDYVLSCTKNNHIEPLKILYEYLLGMNDKFYMDIKYISGASVPVLKIFTKNEYHKISLDISLENPEHHGEECVNYIKQKIQEYEVLTPLTFALKTILLKAFLNDPYKGGLSSYGIILLIINYLNVQQKKGNDISMKSLGRLFYDILHYYGNEYDISNPIIVNENENLPKIISIHQFQMMKSEFILVDPLNIYNNVAKNTRQYQNIQLAFKIGYVSAIESCECGCHYQYDCANIKEEGCEHNLLNRIFNDVKRDWIYS